jgi:hypothetical protein
MAKKLKMQNVDLEFLIVDNGSPHGFLNMKHLCDETKTSSFQVYCIIEKIINEFKTAKED